MSAATNAIHVMSGGAPKEVFALLTPKFERQTGHQVKFTYAVITALKEKLAAGEKADVLVLPAPVLDGLAGDGKVRADGRATFGTVGAPAGISRGSVITWIRRENGVSGLKRLQVGGPGEYRFCEAFYHR